MSTAVHIFVSLALKRALFPERPWPFAVGVVLAGTLADFDILTQPFGPGVYLRGYHTVTHSLIGTFFVIAIAAGYLTIFKSRYSPFSKASLTQPVGFAAILLASSLAAVLHLLIDLAGSWGIALLWPFRSTRFAGDYLPFLDPWILVFLVVGVLLPELFVLIRSEIGARANAPQGRNGAIVALVLTLAFVAARATLHASAIAQLVAHSYQGESPLQVGAFPDSLSPVTWHGVVETASQVCTTDVPAAGNARFDPESAACVHKPEESAALTAAQKTHAAQEFLQAARFPKANVAATADGSEVVLRDMRDVAQNETLHALAARILLDRKVQVTSQSIVWARQVALR